MPPRKYVLYRCKFSLFPSFWSVDFSFYDNRVVIEQKNRCCVYLTHNNSFHLSLVRVSVRRFSIKQVKRFSLENFVSVKAFYNYVLYLSLLTWISRMFARVSFCWAPCDSASIFSPILLIIRLCLLLLFLLLARRIVKGSSSRSSSEVSSTWRIALRSVG